MSVLKEFCSKYEELAKELVRCGSCTNILLHSGGEYEIVQVENSNGKEESVICETCKKHNRSVEMVTRVSEDNHIFQIPISQLDINITEEESLEEQE